MSRRESILCPSCRRLIHVSEERCPHCGTVRPGLWGLTPVLQKLFGQRLDLVKLVTVSCTVLYGATCLLDLLGLRWGGDILGLGAPSSKALYLLGMTGGWAWASGHFWTVLSAVYLHGSILHLAFNMVFLRWLGGEAEEVFGPARFFLLYTLAGVAGFVVSNVVAGSPTIGASGGVFGLLGAMAAFGHRRGGTHGARVSRQMWWLAAGMGVFGLLYPGINNWAHAGGFAAGLVGGWIMPFQAHRAEGRTAMVAAVLALIATLASIVWSFVTWAPVVFGGGG